MHLKKRPVVFRHGSEQEQDHREEPEGSAGSEPHVTVRHNAFEYVAPNGLHTNAAESYFALLKRGLHGAFHHVSKKHLHRYCDEVRFRWNGRKLNDSERRDVAIQQVEGKRLMYKQPA